MKLIKHVYCLVPLLLLLLVAQATTAATNDQAKSRQLQIGQMTVTCFLDLSVNARPPFKGLEQNREYLAAYENEKSPLVTRTYLVKTGKHLVLVDTGWGAGKGQTLNLLHQAGVNQDQITDIILTHMDGDHVAGLVNAKGEPQYPAATLHINELEHQAWFSDKPAEQPIRPQDKINNARKLVNAYGNKVRQFSAGQTILPGITGLAAYGHTPGHTVLELKSDTSGLYIVGDLLHLAALQFRWPDLCSSYDGDQAKAAEARKAIFELSIKNKMPIAGMHFAGIGLLERDGNGGYRMIK